MLIETDEFKGYTVYLYQEGESAERGTYLRTERR